MSIATGLAIATAIFGGDYQTQMVVCHRPVTKRCVRAVRKAHRQDVAVRRWRNHRQSAITRSGWANWLPGVRACESHGNYRINTGNGYYGAYQFSLSTWASVGGKGYPHLAPPLEQDYRAIVLVTTGGPGHWPVCG